MPISGERLLDRGVTHELLDRLRVDPGVDQQRREGVATLVKREGREKVGAASLPLRFLSLALVDRRPGALCRICDRLRIEGFLRPTPECEVQAGADRASAEVIAEDSEDRHRTNACL